MTAMNLRGPSFLNEPWWTFRPNSVGEWVGSPYTGFRLVLVLEVEAERAPRRLPKPMNFGGAFRRNATGPHRHGGKVC